MLATFMDNNSVVAFYSLSDPDGTNILSSLGTWGGYGFASILVPQTPNFSAKAGTWTFKNYANDRVNLSMRTGSTPSAATITVQPYITGTTWSANDVAAALSVMSQDLLYKWYHFVLERHYYDQRKSICYCKR